jgi:hypothetical protein
MPLRMNPGLMALFVLRMAFFILRMASLMVSFKGVFPHLFNGVFEWRLSAITPVFRCPLLPSQLVNLVHPISIAEPPVGRAPPPSLCPANAAHAHIRVVVFAAPLVPLFHGMHVLAVLQLHLLPRPKFSETSIPYYYYHYYYYRMKVTHREIERLVTSKAGEISDFRHLQFLSYFQNLKTMLVIAERNGLTARSSNTVHVTVKQQGARQDRATRPSRKSTDQSLLHFCRPPPARPTPPRRRALAP